MRACVCVLSCVQLCATICPWDSPGNNTGVGLPFPTPGALPDPGIKTAAPASPALAGKFFLPLSNLVRPKQHPFDDISGFCGPELGQSLAGQFSVWPPWCSSMSGSAVGSKMASFK